MLKLTKTILHFTHSQVLLNEVKWIIIIRLLIVQVILYTHTCMHMGFLTWQTLRLLVDEFDTLIRFDTLMPEFLQL